LSGGAFENGTSCLRSVFAVDWSVDSDGVLFRLIAATPPLAVTKTGMVSLQSSSSCSRAVRDPEQGPGELRFGRLGQEPRERVVRDARRALAELRRSDAKATHTYTFPKAWAPGGKVWLGSHPDDHMLQLFGERPAYLLVDANNDGKGDTIYVDLDDDYQFGDEKPVTKSSPVSYRDMNGDGYVDLSGGLVYFIADGTTSLPGGIEVFDDPPVPAANSMVAWTGDFDPGIEGHGTLTASNVSARASSTARRRRSPTSRAARTPEP